MGLAELLSSIETEAAEEAGRLADESRRESEGLVADARARADAHQADAVRTAEADATQEAERRRAEARLRCRRLLAAVREEGFGEVVEEMRSSLAALRDDPTPWRGVLRALLSEAYEALPGARVVRVAAGDDALMDELLAELELFATVEPGLETVGGVELEDGEGRRVVNTLEERLANAEPMLRVAYAGREPAERES